MNKFYPITKHTYNLLKTFKFHQYEDALVPVSKVKTPNNITKGNMIYRKPNSCLQRIETNIFTKRIKS